MRTQLDKVIPFKFDNQSFQVKLIDNLPHFVFKDVCKALGLVNPSKSIKNLDDDEKLTSPIVRAGQTREVWFINESGLYHLIFRSRKPNAAKFRKWVTNEVLPQLRKTGTYTAKSAPLPTSGSQLNLPFQADELINDAYREEIKREMLKVALSAKNGSRVGKFIRLITPLVYGENNAV